MHRTEGGMIDAVTSSALLTLRPFPPVVHPRHAQAVLRGDETFAAWVGAYALPAAEQRRLLEEMLAADESTAGRAAHLQIVARKPGG